MGIQGSPGTCFLLVYDSFFFLKQGKCVQIYFTLYKISTRKLRKKYSQSCPQCLMLQFWGILCLFSLYFFPPSIVSRWSGFFVASCPKGVVCHSARSPSHLQNTSDPSSEHFEKTILGVLEREGKLLATGRCENPWVLEHSPEDLRWAEPRSWEFQEPPHLFSFSLKEVAKDQS